MNAPDSFVERLKSESNNKLRIRWSNKRQEWHIEQKVGRAVLPPSPVSDFDDDHIRARDGYAFVCAVRNGDRMPCPECGIELRVPHLRFGEVRCEYCRLNHRDGRYLAGYFPLGDALLEHLRKIDPDRNWRDDIKQQLDKRNDRLMQSRERDYSNHIEATTLEHYRPIAGIGQWGYNHTAHPTGH